MSSSANLPVPPQVPFAMLSRFRDAAAAAFQAQGDPRVLWRLAELDRSLGRLEDAGGEFGQYAQLHPDEPKATVLRDLMAGTGTGLLAGVNGIVPFLLVEQLASEADLVEVRAAIAARRDRFATATIGHNAEQRVDSNARAAVYIRADPEFCDLTRGFFRSAIEERDVVRRLGLPPISSTRDEVEAIAYAAGGKYVRHRDNSPSAANGRVLTVVWFLHEEPKGFSGGDLLLHDEPPAGQGFTRIVPRRGSAIFFPSTCLHEVTPVDSQVDDVLQSRVVLNGWFHEAGIRDQGIGNRE